MKHRFGHIAFLLCMYLYCVSVHAQYTTFDYLTVEAMISDHKHERTLLTVRATTEHFNERLHEYCKDVVVDYDSLNKKLDKYSRAFDVIDAIWTGCATALHVYNTGDDVSHRVSQIKELIEKFYEECTKQGNIISSDTMIINTCYRTVQDVVDEADQLIDMFEDLWEFATGAKHASTMELMGVMDRINSSLDNISGSVDHAYFVIWRYVYIRTHYWKKQIFRAKDMREYADDALGRWLRVADDVYDKIRSSSSGGSH